MFSGPNRAPTHLCHTTYDPQSPASVHGSADIHGLLNTLAQPLFHAVSPMEKTEGYLIRYLPQHHTQACKVIALITNLLLGLQLQQALPPKPMTDEHKVIPSDT